MKEFEKAARANEGKIVFAYSGLNNRMQIALGEFLEVDPSTFPKLVALRPKEHLRYHSPVKAEFLTEDYINRWVNSVITREERPWVRS